MIRYKCEEYVCMNMIEYVYSIKIHTHHIVIYHSMSSHLSTPTAYYSTSCFEARCCRRSSDCFWVIVTVAVNKVFKSAWLLSSDVFRCLPMSADVCRFVSAGLAKPLSLGAERLLEMGIGDDRDEACAGPCCDGSLIVKHNMCLKEHVSTCFDNGQIFESYHTVTHMLRGCLPQKRKEIWCHSLGLNFPQIHGAKEKWETGFLKWLPKLWLTLKAPEPEDDGRLGTLEEAL